MRPAALPPSTVSNPAMVNGAPALNAAALYVTQTPAALTTTVPLPYTPPPYFSPSGVGNPLVGPSFYSPLVYDDQPDQLRPEYPDRLHGRPGGAEPVLQPGVCDGAMRPTDRQHHAPIPCTRRRAHSSPAPASFNLPAGVPLPTNVAFPTGVTTPAVVTDSVMLPPPIPPARLFQIPDAFGKGQMASLGYTGIMEGTAGTMSGNLPPALSNATDSGDPWINNQVANQMLNPWLNNLTGIPPMLHAQQRLHEPDVVGRVVLPQCGRYGPAT